MVPTPNRFSHGKITTRISFSRQEYPMESMSQPPRAPTRRAEWVPPQEPPLAPVPEELPDLAPDEGPGEPSEVPTPPGEVPPPSPSEG